eukprot:CAMPEP_0172825306 /NCGR_PEP_ID=MMETSP1075-20121228/18576_1 /TAXON_ID=2916 /ORGANISM="Ceratium fusus, Strain PA161109" /LENGTH=312 /DNA_ID=CAMNT_0013666719 /DNA_START=63 /DNA_END=1001 /DNA_ORIENTATION=-
MASAASFCGLMLVLLVQLSAATSPQLRGPGHTQGSLISTKDAIAATDSEDGVASAEATIEEAEKQAANQEATDATATADSGTVPTPSKMTQTWSTRVGSRIEATDATATADSGTVSNNQEAATPKPHSSAKPKDAATRKVPAGRTRRGPQAIKVTIVSAKGLENQDARKRGMTDPFCICEVDKKGSEKVQTMALDGTQGVHWDHEGTIHNFAIHDVLTCSVYDQDALPTDSDRFLGKTTLRGVKVLPGGFEGELPLGGAGPDLAYLKLSIVPMATTERNSDSSSMEDAQATQEGEQDNTSEDDDSDSNDQDD